MRENMKKTIYCIIIATFLSGCNGEGNDEKFAISTPLEPLNQFVNASNIQRINVDEVPVREINITDENRIYSIHEVENEDNPLLGHIKSATKVGSSLFISDITTRSIYKLEFSGDISSALTEAGKGPGELGTSAEVMHNSEFIYVPDHNNGRVNRYSHNFEVERALNNYLMFDMEVSEEYIFGSNRNSQGFAPKNPEEGLIVISTTESLQDTVTTILPRIVPSGYQPNVYNIADYSANSRGQIVAAYSPLPWLFTFDADFQHTNTIMLNYSAFDTLDTAEMEIFKPKGNKGYGGQRPIINFKIMDNGDLFLTLKKELLHLSKNEDQEYKLISRIRFTHDYDAVSSKWTWVPNRVFGASSDTIFVHNAEFVFWFTE